MENRKDPLLILIIDDNPDDRDLFRYLLTKAEKGRYRFLETDSGENGLKLYLENRPDCILLDYHLPDINGIEFLKLLFQKKHPQSIPIIMLTGQGNELVAVQALKSGATDYLVKDNVKKDNIVHAINNAIEKVSMRLAIEEQRIKRDEAEEALKISEIKYRNLFESCLDGIVFVDMNGKIIDANNAFVKMLGYSPEDLKDLSYSQLMPEKWQKFESEICEKDMMNQGFPSELQKVYIKKDGTKFPVSIKAWRIQDEHGQPAGIWRIVRDISERKQLEDALIKAKENAEVANRSKSDFLAKMSHEIRTPMNAIIGMSNLALQTNSADKQQDYLKNILLSAGSLLQLINDILDLSKIEADKLSLNIVKFDLDEVLNSLNALLSVSAKGKGLKLIIFIENNVPRFLIGDSFRLSQVLTNLTGNAIKFTESGTVSVLISLYNEISDNLVLKFSIKDTGIGIASEDIPKLFQSFSQVDVSKTRKYQGSGLGLAISKRIVEMMGGEIDVKSEAGKGSLFTFTAVFRKQIGTEIHEPLISHWMKPSHQNKENLKGIKVLLVEDNLMNQMIAQEFLEKEGLHIAIVQNGIEAIKAVKEKSYDVILMDIEMPEMDGYEATKQIRLFEKQSGGKKRIPIIAMTAHALTGEHEKCIEAEMDDYLSKPIDIEALFCSLNHWIGSEKKAVLQSSTMKFQNDTLFSSNHIIDVQASLLRIGGDMEFFKKLLSNFEKQFKNIVSDVRALLKNGDDKGAANLIHGLKGSAGLLEAHEFNKALLDLEKGIKNRTYGNYDSLLDNFEKYFNQVIEFMHLFQK